MKDKHHEYELVVALDEKGKEKTTARYRGDYFEVRVDGGHPGQFKRKSCLLIGLIAAAHISAGFIGNPSMYRFYIALPYVFAFLPLYRFVEGCLRLKVGKPRYQGDEIRFSIERMRSAAIYLAVILGVVILAQIAIIALVVERSQAGLEGIFLALEALSAAASLALVFHQRKIYIDSCKSEIKEEVPPLPLQ